MSKEKINKRYEKFLEEQRERLLDEYLPKIADFYDIPTLALNSLRQYLLRYLNMSFPIEKQLKNYYEDHKRNFERTENKISALGLMHLLNDGEIYSGLLQKIEMDSRIGGHSIMVKQYPRLDEIERII